MQGTPDFQLWCYALTYGIIIIISYFCFVFFLFFVLLWASLFAMG